MDSSYENQKIVEIEIDKEVKKSFIDYAMSVIVARALPDVRDGLKPVHRRILYAMYENGLTHEKPYKKSVATVGDVLGRYHPHGDASVYDAMVRMVQPFSLRYPLVDGQGNFGNVDGDGAAAYRYTEARMSRISEEMMTDLNKNVVNFVPNYDNKLEEPEVLPSKFPNILVNGSVGIAVGMATNIPTHNLSEVIDGIFAAMDNRDISILELMQYIKGPDFPTYATIYGTAGIMEAYMTGRGKVMVRAKARIEEYKNTHKIIITEIPYQVNKANLVISIADLVKDKRVDGITGITDESGRAGMRIVIDLRRDVNPNVILNQLYKFTQMQDTCAINMIALVGGEPKTLNLKQIIEYYIEHQFAVLRRRLSFDLERARHREHILQGLKIAIDNIDEVIRIIRSNKTIAESKAGLVERFEFSDVQAQSIVDMPLGRLSGMEIEKIIDELMRIQKLIEEICETLASELKMGDIIKTDLLEIKRRYGDERRTEIIPVEDEIFLEDLIDREDCIVTITKDGYIKRQTCDRYQAQRRGGKGINAMGTKEDDFVTDMFTSNSHDYLLMFTNLGRVYTKKCYEIPNASRVSKGTNIVNLLELELGEKITTIIPVTEFDKNALIMVTKKGIIKRTPLSEFERQRRSGKIAITLDEGDSLIFVGKTGGNDDITVISEDGLAIKFSERAIRVMGRQARGVRAIRLKKDVLVAGVAIVENEKGASDLTESAELDLTDTDIDAADEVEVADEQDDEGDSGNDEEVTVDENKPIMITITERGFGKRCEFEKFARRNRGGKGMLCHRLNDKTGKLIGVESVVESDDIMLITDDGTVIRTPVAGIPVYNNRASSGVIVMRLNEGSSIISFVKVKKEEKAQENEANESDEGADAEVNAENAVVAE